MLKDPRVKVMEISFAVETDRLASSPTGCGANGTQMLPYTTKESKKKKKNQVFCRKEKEGSTKKWGGGERVCVNKKLSGKRI